MLFWNPNFEAAFGFRAEQITKTAEFETIAEEERERVEQSVAAALADGLSQIDAEWVSGNDRRIPRHLTFIRVSLKGHPCVLGIAVDSRKLREAEEKLRESEEQYRLLIANIPEVVWKTDLEGNVMLVSPQVSALLGYTPAEFDELGDSLWFNSIHPDDRERVTKAFEALIHRGASYDVECRVQRKNGDWFWAHDRAVTTVDPSGVRIATGLVSDVTARKAGEEALRRLASIVESSQDAIIGRDTEGVITSWNSGAEKMYGYSADEMVGQVGLFLLPNDKHSDFPRFMSRLKAGEHITAYETRRVTKQGAILDVSMSLSPLRDHLGNIVGISTIAHDITARKAAEEQVNFLAYYDALTGLPNRVLLQDRLRTALAGADRRKTKVALIFFDLDRFKFINDSLGHSAGDALLQEVACRLTRCGREQDTVARLGGDEFLIVVTDVKRVSDVAIVAERIMAAMAPELVIQQHPLNIKCSMGISIFPDHGGDLETLLRNADAAMYSAKENGRNNYRFFTEAMNTEVMERVTLEHGLRLALGKGDFFLVYQPQMDLRTGKVVGVEALLRWPHPELGLVSPVKFIPIAESSGLIMPIGEWVLRTACSQARKWQDEGLPSISVAVNVSAVQFRHEGFCGLIRRVLQETGLDPHFLELELTESFLLAEKDATLAVIQELKRIGVSLAIDDFGTGYSSFGYLRQFRANKIKIDSLFIKDVAVNADDAAITAAIISMAKTLRLKVIAEGVETEDQLSFLKAHQCDEIQGYLFSKPLSIADAADKLRGSLPKALAAGTEG